MPLLGYFSLLDGLLRSNKKFFWIKLPFVGSTWTDTKLPALKSFWKSFLTKMVNVESFLPKLKWGWLPHKVQWHVDTSHYYKNATILFHFHFITALFTVQHSMLYLCWHFCRLATRNPIPIMYCCKSWVCRVLQMYVSVCIFIVLVRTYYVVLLNVLCLQCDVTMAMLLYWSRENGVITNFAQK